MIRVICDDSPCFDVGVQGPQKLDHPRRRPGVFNRSIGGQARPNAVALGVEMLQKVQQANPADVHLGRSLQQWNIVQMFNSYFSSKKWTWFILYIVFIYIYIYLESP